MLVKELKQIFPNLEIPVLIQNKDGIFISFIVKNIKDLDDNSQIDLPVEEFVDIDQKYICLGKELYYLRSWGEMDEHIVAEMDELEKRGLKDETKEYFIKLQTKNKKEKLNVFVEDEKIEKVEESIKQELPDVKCEIKIELNKKIENNKQEIPKVIQFPKNDDYDSTKNKIIKECLIENPPETLDNFMKADILGRVWNVEKLKSFIGWQILVDCLDKGYPPYLANNDKEEIELLNKAFIEKTGRKAFS
jgi:hypothetical protein